jgi:hypothetical protein
MWNVSAGCGHAASHTTTAGSLHPTRRPATTAWATQPTSPIGVRELEDDLEHPAGIRWFSRPCGLRRPPPVAAPA